MRSINIIKEGKVKRVKLSIADHLVITEGWNYCSNTILKEHSKKIKVKKKTVQEKNISNFFSNFRDKYKKSKSI